MIQLIIRALQFSLELNIEYNKSDIIYPYEPRPIRPEALAMRKSKTPYGLDEYYLIAYCFSRKDFRTFKLSRIHKVTLTGKIAIPTDHGIKEQEECRRNLQKEIDTQTQQLEALKQELKTLNEQAKVDSKNPDSPSTKGLLQKLQQQQQEISFLNRKNDDHVSTFKVLVGLIVFLLLCLLGNCVYTHFVKEDKTCPKCRRYEKRIQKMKDFREDMFYDDEIDDPPGRAGHGDW